MPPLYQSTGSQYFRASSEAKALSLCGSVYLRKYQLEPAQLGMVSASLTAGPPQRGQVVCSQSLARARQLEPSSVGEKSSSMGSSKGSSLSLSGTQPHLSHFTRGIGSPQ